MRLIEVVRINFNKRLRNTKRKGLLEDVRDGGIKAWAAIEEEKWMILLNRSK